MTIPSPLSSLAARLGLFLAVLAAPDMASAADRFTCMMIEKLMETTDTGLEAVIADPVAFRPASGIATYAREAQTMADRSSVRDRLPDEVVAALTAVADAATAGYSIADAAPVLLEQGLIVQKAMPDICPGTEIPDLRRHEM
jgi:hypothetical protein